MAPKRQVQILITGTCEFGLPCLEKGSLQIELKILRCGNLGKEKKGKGDREEDMR